MPKSVRYIQMLPLERRAEELGQGFWLSVALALPDARLQMLQRQTLFHFSSRNSGVAPQEAPTKTVK